MFIIYTNNVINLPFYLKFKFKLFNNSDTSFSIYTYNSFSVLLDDFENKKLIV